MALVREHCAGPATTYTDVEFMGVPQLIVVNAQSSLQKSDCKVPL